VAPGQIATFVWSFKTPLTITSGIYRFNGDLALATAPSVQIHPEGYLPGGDLRLPPGGQRRDVLSLRRTRLVLA
jgi:hypothetical protein